ncbi:MAG: biotin--[acetyl-CoA-carboxylase] ligase [Planctomycetota bacterium]
MSAFTRRADDASWPPGIWHAAETDSTNLEALRRAADTFASGACFTADEQTAGRGRLGRKWVATRGHGLAFSLAYSHVTLPHEHLLWMHLAVAASVAAVAGTLSVAGRPGLKWPNDVVVIDDGDPSPVRKLCGVLTETATEADGNGLRVAIGCGINVNHTADDFPPDLRDTATSLRMLAGAVQSLDDIRSRVLREIATRHDAIARGDITAVRDEVRARSLLPGRNVEVTRPDGRVLAGRAHAIDDGGRLVLDADDGQRYTLDSGDVTRVRPRGR